MRQPQHFISLCIAAMLALPAGIWMVLAGQPVAHAGPLAIATGNKPAIVTLNRPQARSLAGEASLRITVRPEVVERGESYIVNVYVLPQGFKQGETTGSGGAEAGYLGSFSFFPPPRQGEVRTFTLAAPEFPAGRNATLSLRIELVPASPDAKLQKSTLAIIDAKVVD